jgi:antitoxin component YwqK of YwqJK toxin-antitoxin module
MGNFTSFANFHQPSFEYGHQAFLPIPNVGSSPSSSLENVESGDDRIQQDFSRAEIIDEWVQTKILVDIDRKRKREEFQKKENQDYCVETITDIKIQLTIKDERSLKRLRLDDPDVLDRFVDNIRTFRQNHDVQVNTIESKSVTKRFKRIDGKLNGEGIVIFSDGEKQKGIFVDGFLNGKGKIIYVNGKIAKGEFKDGLLHGKGKIIRIDGRIKQGEFKDGKRITSLDPQENSD